MMFLISLYSSLMNVYEFKNSTDLVEKVILARLAPLDGVSYLVIRKQ